MNSKKEVQHVYLVGAKSLGAYGGYETFVYKLTEYHQNKENIKYHVACKANGDGCMDESKFEGVTKINDHEFEFHNAHCFKIDVPQIGSAQAIYYDVAALKACCEHIKKIQKDLEAKQKELDDLKAETILVIRGVSALDKELLGTLVAEAREALETLEKQLVQAQEEYEEATKTAKRSNYICNELFTWADVYDTANHDERRAILQQFIKEIRVRKDYEISITLNASFNQVEQLKAVSTYDGAEIFEEISEKGA